MCKLNQQVLYTHADFVKDMLIHLNDLNVVSHHKHTLPQEGLNHALGIITHIGLLCDALIV